MERKRKRISLEGEAPALHFPDKKKQSQVVQLGTIPLDKTEDTVLNLNVQEYLTSLLY
jgi:hypothetical protein